MDANKKENGIPQINLKKIRGVADIVLLIDSTESMKPCIDGLKQNIKEAFIKVLEGGGAGGGQRPLQAIKWRARVISYRDVTADGDKWIELTNGFVEKADDLRAQLDAMIAMGGGDPEETALDAIYMAIKDTKWRDKYEAHKYILLFSDADTKGTMHEGVVEQDESLEIDHLIHLLVMNRIKVYAVVPETDNYKKLLNKLPKSITMYVGKPGEENVYQGLQNQNYQKLLEALAKTVSQSSAEVVQT
jgi:hypothetical protein